MSELKLCDLVMKGGITSGIVYPSAILELQKHFQFKNIGGTSAGAMAAAATAAAELNRFGNGFQELKAIHNELNQPGKLLDLFQAQPETRPLLDIFLALLNASAVSPAEPLPLFLRLMKSLFAGKVQTDKLDLTLQIVNTLRRKWSAPESLYRPFVDGGRRGLLFAGGGMLLLLLIPSLALLIFALNTSSVLLPLAIWSLFVLLFTVLAGWLGLWLGRIVGTSFALSGLITAEHFYGICNGHTPSSDPQSPQSNLTDWLTTHLDTIAGLSSENAEAGTLPTNAAPLTFGHLRERDINLQMVTSNISLGLPCVMPQDLIGYIFNEDEWRRFFPDYVVDTLMKQSPRSPLINKDFLPAGYYFLPDPDNLPVVVCTRMSLSFPILLCAVPLYTLSTRSFERYRQQSHPERLDKDDLQQHWFSDGGICSNFPIQFFDAWLPTRPTFGINLTRLPSANSALKSDTLQREQPVPAQCASTVYLPPTEECPALEWQQIDSIFKFGQALFGIAQNYHDTLQANLPSYRERIVQIRLADDEGGLHLTMKPATVQCISEKGYCAAKLLSDQFDFDHHWWVRFLVLMARLEEEFEQFAVLFDDSGPDAISNRIQRACRGHDQSPKNPYPYPYQRDEKWCQEAIERMEILHGFIQNWQTCSKRSNLTHLFRENAPLPNPVLRVTPEL